MYMYMDTHTYKYFNPRHKISKDHRKFLIIFKLEISILFFTYFDDFGNLSQIQMEIYKE